MKSNAKTNQRSPSCTECTRQERLEVAGSEAVARRRRPSAAAPGCSASPDDRYRHWCTKWPSLAGSSLARMATDSCSGEGVCSGRPAPVLTPVRPRERQGADAIIQPQCLRGGHYMSAFVDEYMAKLKAKNPRSRIPPGRPGSRRVHRAGAGQASRSTGPQDPRAHRRARARDHVPCALGRRQGRGPGQPRFPHRDE